MDYPFSASERRPCSKPSYNQQKSGATIIRLADRYRTAAVRVSPCDVGTARVPFVLALPYHR